MYQPFHKLRVRFAELEMKQGEVAKRANMAESTLTSTGHSNGRPLDCSAYTYPTNAKGSANIVWENLTSDA